MFVQTEAGIVVSSQADGTVAVATPGHHFTASEGKQDYEEIQEMRKHPLIGRQVLQDVIDQYGIQQPDIPLLA